MIAEAMAKVADKKSEKLRLEGNLEGELQKVFGMERQYEYLDLKLEVLQSMGGNKDIKIYGNTSDNAVNQMAAYRLLHPNDFHK